jgi:hypothetical protein
MTGECISQGTFAATVDPRSTRIAITRLNRRLVECATRPLGALIQNAGSRSLELISVTNWQRPWLEDRADGNEGEIVQVPGLCSAIKLAN